jgi:hypothetical protein
MSSPVAITVRVALDASKPRKFELEPLSDPVRKLVRVREAIARSKKEHNRRLYKALQVACIIALQLEGDPEAWRRITTHKLWPTAPSRNLPNFAKRLRLMMMFELSYTSERRRCISRNAKAIVNLLNAGVSPERVAGQLERRGGIAKCAKQPRGSSKAKELKRADALRVPQSASRVVLKMRNADRKKLYDPSRKDLVVIVAARSGPKRAPTLKVRHII